MNFIIFFGIFGAIFGGLTSSDEFPVFEESRLFPALKGMVQVLTGDDWKPSIVARSPFR